ncbi:hypothetical protein AAKU55_004956, partial [Oxalobacteraceae bacterium GrIS 1.11]
KLHHASNGRPRLPNLPVPAIKSPSATSFARGSNSKIKNHCFKRFYDFTSLLHPPGGGKSGAFRCGPFTK